MPESPDHPTGRLAAEEARFAKLQARRRFARAGIAGPIVLSSLVSTNGMDVRYYRNGAVVTY